MTATLAWIAAVVCWHSMWLCGRKRRSGWLVSLVAAVLWTVVNARMRLWGGVGASLVTGAISLRNWRSWRAPGGCGASRSPSAAAARDVPAARCL